MNKAAFILITLVLFYGIVCGQTNTFPATGNAGIGTISPGAKLSFNNVDDGSNGPDGITWHNPYPLDYGIFRTAGPWAGPNYQQLNLSFVTGIILNPGSAYGKSYVDVQGGGLRVSSGNVGIGTASTPAYRLDVTGPGNDWKARFQGPDGYILVGPANPYWAHIYTDRPAFLFNQNVYSSQGVFSSYNTADLALQTHGSTRLLISNASGYVGIGTTTPSGLLEVKGPYSGDSQLVINSTGSNAELRFSDNGLPKGFVWYDKVSDVMAFGRGNFSNSIVVNSAGNVGVGTSNPTQKFTVNGIIYGKEIKVDLSVPGPDYVFEEDYRLLSLDDVEEFVKKNKHLPEVPAAKEMAANGIEVGEMNMILLKKIEELTLYIIQLQNKVEKQEQQIEKF